LGVDRLLGSIIMPEVFAGVRPPGCHLPNLWDEGQREAVFRGLPSPGPQGHVYGD